MAKNIYFVMQMKTTNTTPISILRANCLALLLLLTMGFSTLVEMSFSWFTQIDTIELVDIMDGELELDEKKETEKEIFKSDQWSFKPEVKVSPTYIIMSLKFPDAITLEEVTPPPRQM